MKKLLVKREVIDQLKPVGPLYNTKICVLGYRGNGIITDSYALSNYAGCAFMPGISGTDLTEACLKFNKENIIFAGFGISFGIGELLNIFPIVPSFPVNREGWVDVFMGPLPKKFPGIPILIVCPRKIYW